MRKLWCQKAYIVIEREKVIKATKCAQMEQISKRSTKIFNKGRFSMKKLSKKIALLSTLLIIATFLLRKGQYVI